MTSILPTILRRYYDASFDGRLGAYAGATWPEYLALIKRRLPKVTPRWAAEEAARLGRSDLLSHVARFSPEPPWVDATGVEYLASKYPSVRESKKGRVDLARRIGARDVRVIELQRSDIVGWQGLAGRKLKFVELRRCKTDALAEIAPRCSADWLSLYLSSKSCATVLCSGTRARTLVILHNSPFDLRLLARQSRLEDLGIAAPTIVGARHLRSAVLARLRLGRYDLDDEILATVVAHEATLSDLELESDVPFRPQDLPRLPKLRQLTVPAYEEHRAAWLDFAARFKGHVAFSHPGRT
ncbi:hypothetical protein BH11MYX4_BH11MYX4_01440 [soil metagenome]